MKVIHSNERRTVGILSGVDGLRDIGLFNRKDIEDWMRSIKDVFGDDDQVYIQIKESDNKEQAGFMICASTEGEDPKVAVCGTFRADGKKWGE